MTPEQVERIRAFKEILREHDRTTLEAAVRNFGADAHPAAARRSARKGVGIMCRRHYLSATL